MLDSITKEITIPYREGVFNFGDRLFEHYKSDKHNCMIVCLLYSADNGYSIEVISKTDTHVTFKTVYTGHFNDYMENEHGF